MKYLLVVGFFCDVYRREPRARLFFNDRLIDEFNIQHQPENKYLIPPAMGTKHVLEPFSCVIVKEYKKKYFPSLRFYEIDVDDQLKISQIRIDIDNDDSNYANGFLSRFTQLKFSVLSLFPLDKKIYKCFEEKKNNQRDSNKYAWYRRDRVNTFFKTDQTTVYNRMIWLGINGQKIQGDVTKMMCKYNIGGSGSLHYELIKKYGILLERFLDPMLPYIYMIDDLFFDVIYDKYDHYANQRNSD
jgi:hypothetical protein